MFLNIRGISLSPFSGFFLSIGGYLTSLQDSISRMRFFAAKVPQPLHQIVEISRFWTYLLKLISLEFKITFLLSRKWISSPGAPCPRVSQTVPHQLFVPYLAHFPIPFFFFFFFYYWYF